MSLKVKYLKTLSLLAKTRAQVTPMKPQNASVPIGICGASVINNIDLIALILNFNELIP